jgi:hypothetical protein
MLYAYIFPLKFSSKCIDPNYFFYRFECFHMICPNLSSAPCISEALRSKARVIAEKEKISILGIGWVEHAKKCKNVFLYLLCTMF